ncbi:uncharacterized protein LOC117512901 [Thalassophryne amazonica]|uniref:uncharacterized protein LOC117512901 n=1 Tax=Thalassophryne amazonica TaxID=390379 RepID=UPI001471EE9E|nr:uncharacterized protein LOC117512901 [Thalassophryne amazonica]
MDDLDALEVYIPMEAEVKSIPVSSLPKTMLTKERFPLNGSEVPLTDSPNAVWISPAVIRMKGQLAATRESIVSLLSERLKTAQGPYNMAFVSSNHTAYRVLKDTLPGSKVSSTTSHTPLLPLGNKAQTRQNVLVIHCGQIYLNIKRPACGCKGGRNRMPNPPMPGTHKMDLLSHDQGKRMHTTHDVQHNESQDHYEPPSKVAHPSIPLPAGVFTVDNLCQDEHSQPANRQAARESLLFHPQRDKGEVATALGCPCASPCGDLCESPEVSRPVGGLSATPEVTRPVGGLSAISKVSRPVGGLGATPQLSRPVSGLSVTPQVSRPVGGLSLTSEMSRPVGGLSATPKVSRPVGGLSATSEMSRPVGRLSATSEMSRPVGRLSATSEMSRPVGGLGVTPQVSRPVGGLSLTSEMSRPVGGLSATPKVSRPVGGLSATSEMSRPVGRLSATSEMSRPVGGLGVTPQVSRRVGGLGAPSELSRPVGGLCATSGLSRPVGGLGTTSGLSRPVGGLGATLGLSRPVGGLGATSEVSAADSDPFVSPEQSYEASQSADSATGSHSWTRKDSFSTTVPGHEVDFNEMAQDEKIARMKAKLRESEAALSRLQLPC